MKFTLKIETGNVALTDEDRETELSRILDIVSAEVMDGRQRGGCRDVNGNAVGEWAITDEESDADPDEE